MPEGQSFSEIEQRRRRELITNLAFLSLYDRLEDQGITVLERDGPPNESCYEYTFPGDKYPSGTLNKVLTSWHSPQKPAEGDVVLYFNDYGDLTHVGKVVENGKVRSRWGMGGILCEHAPDDIPNFWGGEVEIKYFREPK